MMLQELCRIHYEVAVLAGEHRGPHGPRRGARRLERITRELGGLITEMQRHPRYGASSEASSGNEEDNKAQDQPRMTTHEKASTKGQHQPRMTTKRRRTAEIQDRAEQEGGEPAEAALKGQQPAQLFERAEQLLDGEIEGLQHGAPRGFNMAIAFGI